VTRRGLTIEPRPTREARTVSRSASSDRSPRSWRSTRESTPSWTFWTVMSTKRQESPPEWLRRAGAVRYWQSHGISDVWGKARLLCQMDGNGSPQGWTASARPLVRPHGRCAGGVEEKRKNSLRRKKVKWARPAVTPYRVGLDGLGPPTCPPAWAARMKRKREEEE